MESGNTFQNRNSTGTTGAGNSKILAIEGYACLIAITFCFLTLCGSVRRRNHNAVLVYAIKGAYLLTASLVTYTLGQMQSAHFRNELFAVWTLFLGVALGSSDTITVFSLEANENLLEHNLKTLAQMIWIVWLTLTYPHETNFPVFVWLLYVLFLFRSGEQSEAMRLARKLGRGKNSKNISDYMLHDKDSEANDSVANDPADYMRNCIYLVNGEGINVGTNAPHYRANLKTTAETITVRKVWEYREYLGSLEDKDGELKDILLSHALFKLLCRRFSELPFAESSLKKTWNFVCQGLIDENDVERAFRVIEVELAFLYDFFYTKYPVIFRSESLLVRIAEAIYVFIGFWFAGDSIKSYVYGQKLSNLDLLVTEIIVLSILFVEIVQIVYLIYSDWLKLYLLCKCITQPTWRGEGTRKEVIRFICRRKMSKPWERKLGQYSLLTSLQPANIFVKAYRCALTLFEDEERIGITEDNRIDLPVQVKRAVTNSLMGLEDRKLTNGVTCLKKYVQNGVIDQELEEEILQACGLETQTHVILVWHIATSLLKDEYLKNRGPRSDDFITATSLSNYCAYLVAFAPQLLPENARTTEVIFCRVIVEGKRYFRRTSFKDLCDQLLRGNINMNTISAKGVSLAFSLSHIPDAELVWGFLSEFWAELMLFLSPSDDWNAHAEYLARGGEFVTHLWALLSHAGILQRPSPQPQEQQQTATAKQTEKISSAETETATAAQPDEIPSAATAAIPMAATEASHSEIELASDI